MTERMQFDIHQKRQIPGGKYWRCRVLNVHWFNFPSLYKRFWFSCLSRYQNLETFIIDVNLVFDNCEKYNEDNSDIGRAGHNMRKFFEKRWTELLKQTN